MNQSVSKFAKPISLATLAVAVTAASVSAQADCTGGRCASYDYSIPVTINTSGVSPAFTVMGGSIGVGTTSPTSPLTVAGVIESQSGGIKFPDGTTQTTAASGTGGSSSQWTTTLSGISFSGGGVGIGESPIDGLDLAAGAGFSELANKYIASNVYWNGTAFIYRGNGTAASLKLSDSSVGGATLQMFPANTAGAGATATGADVLTVLANGNVGIGSTAPGSKLVVKGGSSSFIALSTDYSNGSTGSSLSLGPIANTGNGGSYIQAKNTGGTAAASLIMNSSGGNVGVGLSSPSYLLDVGAPSGDGNYMRISGHNSTGLLINNGTTGNTFGFYNGAMVSNGFNGLALFDGNNYRMTFFDASTGSDFIALNQDGGNVGIGTVTPGYILDVNGDINSSSALRVAGTSVCTSSGCTAASDKRLKTNIKSLDENSAEKLSSLKPVRYDWKDKKKYGSESQIGFIAQDLEKIYPEFVKTDSANGMKSVDYARLVVPLIQSVNQLSRHAEQLSEQVKVLSAENVQMAKELRQLNESQSE